MIGHSNSANDQHGILNITPTSPPLAFRHPVLDSAKRLLVMGNSRAEVSKVAIHPVHTFIYILLEAIHGILDRLHALGNSFGEDTPHGLREQVHAAVHLRSRHYIRPSIFDCSFPEGFRLNF